MLFKAESFAKDIHWNLIFAVQTLNNLLLSVFKDSCVCYISLKFLVITSFLFFFLKLSDLSMKFGSRFVVVVCYLV